jgi:putative ABC transport system permease protein
MDIRPILSTLRRHKTAAALIVLEVALTCAIVCNAIFLIASRLERMERPTGIAESELVRIEVSGVARIDNADAMTLQDLATLRALPGVKGATIVNQFPFSISRSTSTVNLAPRQEQPTLAASYYAIGDGGVDALGLRIVEGRDFHAEEYRFQSELEKSAEIQMPVVMLDRAAAERLFPGRSALGQTIYVFGETPSRVVGIVERLVPPQPGSAEGDYTMIVPVRPSFRGGGYFVRVDPDRRDAVLGEAAAALEALDTRRIISKRQRFDQIRHDHFRQDRWMTWLLVATCAALLVVTAFGIVGLASFWVQQRTRMIGVRRALGASRRQILGYFQTENFLLTSFGIVFGMAGAYAINHVLMTQYELQRLPWIYLPVGAVILWLLGQVAVLGPARRAAALPPVAVMRGV